MSENMKALSDTINRLDDARLEALKGWARGFRTLEAVQDANKRLAEARAQWRAAR